MSDSSLPWYSKQGNLDDVVLSSRVRISRNLEGFPFPERCSVEQRERVQSLVIDSCNKISEPFSYDFIPINSLDNSKKQVLAEQGLCSAEEVLGIPFGLIQTGTSGQFATTNFHDHIRLTGFSSGLSLDSIMLDLARWEMNLSNSLTFAREDDLGYLTSLVRDSGSGVKTSILLHLPGITQSGMIEKVIRDTLSRGFLINGFYGSKNGSSLGDLYLAFCYSADSSVDASSQVEALTSLGRVLRDLDAHCMLELSKNRKTFLRDYIYRSFTLVNSVLFLPRFEFLHFISSIRTGLRLNMLSGITFAELSTLYYDTGIASLQLLDTISAGQGRYKFEPDILSHTARIDRLRAQLVQERLNNVRLVSDY